jgi:hypothetical protein
MSLFGSTRKVAVSLGLMALLVVSGWVRYGERQEPQKVRILVGRSAVLSVPDSIGTVSIADDEIADVVVATSRQLLLNAKKIGTTSLVVWSKGNRYQTFEVVVHSGTGFNQVVLNVKIAEVSRSRLKQLGFDFFVNMLNSRRLEGSGTIGFFGGQVNTPRIPILPGPAGRAGRHRDRLRVALGRPPRPGRRQGARVGRDDQDPGQPEPGRGQRREGEVPVGRRDSDPGRPVGQRRQLDLGRVQGVRRQAGLRADGDRLGNHQPAGRARSQHARLHAGRGPVGLPDPGVPDAPRGHGG